jgi:SOS-response transcriptional repressor LexA
MSVVVPFKGRTRHSRRPHHKSKKPVKKFYGVTIRQKKMLDIIKKYLKTNEHAPSYEELRQLCGLKSKSNVHRYLHCLRERGYITFKDHMKRGIMVL